MLCVTKNLGGKASKETDLDLNNRPPGMDFPTDLNDVDGIVIPCHFGVFINVSWVLPCLVKGRYARSYYPIWKMSFWFGWYKNQKGWKVCRCCTMVLPIACVIGRAYILCCETYQSMIWFSLATSKSRNLKGIQPDLPRTVGSNGSPRVKSEP